ncbi:MAG: hypothetical protein J6Q78_00355, partial [Clostridia bacterium]|nr:hypothetical protein [Clostridia bacterium]
PSAPGGRKSEGEMGGEKERRMCATAYASEATISTSGLCFKSLLLRQNESTAIAVLFVLLERFELS